MVDYVKCNMFHRGKRELQCNDAFYNTVMQIDGNGENVSKL